MSWYDDLIADAEACARKARDAETPELAEAWFDAAAAAASAAMAVFPQPLIQQTQPLQLLTPLSAPFSDRQCPYCCQPISKCPGHNIC